MKKEITLQDIWDRLIDMDTTFINKLNTLESRIEMLESRVSFIETDINIVKTSILQFMQKTEESFKHLNELMEVFMLNAVHKDMRDADKKAIDARIDDHENRLTILEPKYS